MASFREINTNEGGFMKKENAIMYEIYTKHNTPVLLVLFTVLFLIISLTGCATSDNPAQSDGKDIVNATSADCALCGDNGEDSYQLLWGQDNIALVSLNSFDIKTIGINQFDSEGKLREEYAGVVSFAGGEGKDGGFSAHLLVDYGRGFADGTFELNNDDAFDYEKVSSSLCADCLEKLEFYRAENCVGVAAIDLQTKEIRVFEKDYKGFGLGDFYLDFNFEQGSDGENEMNLLIVYCPVRYEK